MEAIGESIRLHRLKNGMSQEQLALNAGVNTSYIGQIEREKRTLRLRYSKKFHPLSGFLSSLFYPHTNQREEG